MTDPTPTWFVGDTGVVRWRDAEGYTAWAEVRKSALSHTRTTEAQKALADIVRLHDGLVSCLRRYQDGWQVSAGTWVRYHDRVVGFPGVEDEPISDAERVALDWLQETAT